ncbi:MAG: ribose-phosphate pyrophosphokinase [Firmicutes bacterium]|nr:ribose-phosphate pyrophosphokinase [Bacillota bacterium]
MASKKGIKIFTGTSNRDLAENVAAFIGIPLGLSEITRFSDGETAVSIGESVRGKDVFVIQSLCNPVNDHLLELLIFIDALKRASAGRINAVIPYYGYARQDRKMKARDPITAKLVADLISRAGAERVMCMDLHAGQIQGFFDIPVDHLLGIPILARYMKKKEIQKGVVVAPDLGGVTRARDLAARLGMPLAIIDKRRPAPNEAEVMNIIGDVEGREAIMIDDLIDTGGTIVQGAEELLKRGAISVYACCTHPVLSGPAKTRIQNSEIRELVVTDTIPLRNSLKMEKITVLSVAGLIGDAIKRVHGEMSVSELFE